VLWRADLEHSAQDLPRAAMLLGVLEALERDHSPPEPIFEGTRRSRLQEELASGLGADLFHEALSRSRALSREEAINLVVGD